jgi:hypothetical protein
MKLEYFIVGFICLVIIGCASLKDLSFSGTDLELAMGNDRGTDMGQPTNKMMYTGLVRFRFDIKKTEDNKSDIKKIEDKK